MSNPCGTVGVITMNMMIRTSSTSISGTMFGSEFNYRNESEKPRPLALDLAPRDAIVAPGDYQTATKGWDEKQPQ